MIENIEVAVVCRNEYGDDRTFSQTWTAKPEGPPLRLIDAIRLENSYIAELEENHVVDEQNLVVWSVLACMNFTNGMTVFVPEKHPNWMQEGGE